MLLLYANATYGAELKSWQLRDQVVTIYLLPLFLKTFSIVKYNTQLQQRVGEGTPVKPQSPTAQAASSLSRPETAHAVT